MEMLLLESLEHGSWPFCYGAQMCSWFRTPLHFGAPKYVSAVKQVLIASARFIHNLALKGPRRRALPGLCNYRDYQRKGSFFNDQPVERRDAWLSLRETSLAGTAGAEERDLPVRSGRGFWKEGKSVEFSQQRSPASWMQSPAVTCLARSSWQEQSKA